MTPNPAHVTGRAFRTDQVLAFRRWEKAGLRPCDELFGDLTGATGAGGALPPAMVRLIILLLII